jgi:O-antigen ligase
MGLSTALLITALGVVCLLYLDRDKFYRPSKALWLPLIFLWIVGSRPLSAWLGIWFGVNLWTPGGSLEAQLDGSPLDAVVYSIMLAIGVMVLVRRGRIGPLLKASSPIVIFYIYCLLSICWSHIPEVALKRWIKDVCELVMVLVIVTDPKPIEAMRRIFTYVGLLLFPASIVLSKYSALGRAYDPSGFPVSTGVSTNKNSLGMMTYVISIGVFWVLFHLFRSKREPGRMRRLVAQGTVLGFGVAVLAMAHSATSIACFVLGSTLILCTYLPFVKRRPQRIHALVLMILCFGGVAMLFGGEGAVTGALGRDATFTGRTDIWKTVIPMCPNPLVGAGFESFWNTYGGNLIALGPYLKGINSAHNGYIETYLNLGSVGLCAIGFVFIGGYRRVCAAFRRNQEIGCLMLAYMGTSAIYSFSEAGFRELTDSWIALLLAVIASSGVAAGLVGNGIQQVPRLRTRRVHN